MTHMEWGLLALVAALVLGGLLGGPVWYAVGHRHGREDGAYGDGPRHRKGDPAPGFLLELPGPQPEPQQAGTYGPFPVSEEEYVLLTSPLLPAEFEAHAGEAMAVANDSHEETAGFISRNDGTQIGWDPSVTAWTAAMAADMERYIARLVGSTDEQLRDITR